jgi:hypothetical protein
MRIKTESQWLAVVIVMCVALFTPAFAQDTAEIAELVRRLKSDPRGPFQRIAWFCPDGTVLPAKDRCPEPGGIQHGLHKDVVTELTNQGIYLGQLLAGQSRDAFLDRGNFYSRVKQYQIERFLQAADDGWIMRGARTYRGAMQAEDEEAWGADFMRWALMDENFLVSHFYFARELARDIPHAQDVDRATLIRALSKRLASGMPSFMPIRVKIHGQPDSTDITALRQFRKQHEGRAAPEAQEILSELEEALVATYEMAGVSNLRKFLPRIPSGSPVYSQLRSMANAVDGQEPDVATQCRAMASLLWTVRENIATPDNGEDRLAYMDLSISLEALLFRTVAEWQPETVGATLEKAVVLALAAAGCGFLEVWEWERLRPALDIRLARDEQPLLEFSKQVRTLQQVVQWSVATIRANYKDVVELFAAFEPISETFYDDRVRSSILLTLGIATSRLADVLARNSGIANEVTGAQGQNLIRGLNPGFAFGELVVVRGTPNDLVFSPDKIYAMEHPPEDLEPVAGILSVTEGNVVSHVQLLARNLGIPNASIVRIQLRDLNAFAGRLVFFAVSPGGRVILRPVSEMTDEERALVEVAKELDERIAVPVDKIDLRTQTCVGLTDLRASDSGRICGPKAANLGQLKAIFPVNVTSGFAVPFGIFRTHLDQPMEGTSGSYWQFLVETFAEAQRTGGDINDATVERYVVERLAQLRRAIEKMPLLAAFRDDLASRFNKSMGRPLGSVPVFIRSDTNMEDLKDFTGAGLNLTVVNALSERDIHQAIRDVWASPFTERSYRWRQRYLTNPENVYPSILILESISADKSGVMITTGIATNQPEDVTVAFNWGVGGAVAGQAAETYVLQSDGRDGLVSPAREVVAVRLPERGGFRREFVTFDQPILNVDERRILRSLAADIRARVPGTPGIESSGPFDVELGFAGGKIWLFQLRPFVENKRARSSAYLRGLDTDPPVDAKVALQDRIREEPVQ